MKGTYHDIFIPGEIIVGLRSFRYHPITVTHSQILYGLVSSPKDTLGPEYEASSHLTV